jgi:rhodanese-related sulfurtransferase
MIVKRAFWFILLLLSFVLVACGGSEAETAVSEPVAAIDVSALPEQISVEIVHQVKDQDDVFVIDVREQDEYDQWHIPGVTLIPMSTFQQNMDQLPVDKEIIVTCNSGNRSGQVTDFLLQNGYTNVHNMEGGIVAWDKAGFEVNQ